MNQTGLRLPARKLMRENVCKIFPCQKGPDAL